MDLTKQREFFNPANVGRVHIIGCGSVGSSLAELLARTGVEKFTLWDFDTVESHNICNQMFNAQDVSKLKVDAVKEMVLAINPEAEVITESDGWHGQRLNGSVFLAVDSIETRQEIVKANFYNQNIKGVFDFRTRLCDGQAYAADWGLLQSKKYIRDSMNFTHEEALKDTPVSACGIVLGCAPTVRVLVALGVANWMNFMKGGKLKKFIQVDPFNGVLDSFE